MKLNEIQELWQKDAEIDPSSLDLESLKIPKLHSKYYNIMSNEVLIYKKLIRDQKVLKHKRFEYYTGRATAEEYKSAPHDLKILKNEAPMYLEADEQLLAIQEKLDIQAEKISFLKDVISSINFRSNTIKNAIEWQKFMNGLA